MVQHERKLLEPWVLLPLVLDWQNLVDGLQGEGNLVSHLLVLFLLREGLFKRLRVH